MDVGKELAALKRMGVAALRDKYARCSVRPPARVTARGS